MMQVKIESPLFLLGAATSVLVIFKASCALAFTSSSSSKNEKLKAMLPSKVQSHQFIRKESGRTIGYYTFGDDNNNTTHNNSSKPILYLHGTPGSGMEAAIYGCAQFAPLIVGVDRPGMGWTDPDDDDDDSCCCNDIWALAEQLQWKSFSVLAISGGCPPALALLASYLEQSPTHQLPVLENLALVGGLCGSAGTEGMMSSNQQVCEIVKTYETSWVSRVQIHLVWSVQAFLLRLVPRVVVNKFIELGMKMLPEIDQAVTTPRLDEIATIARIALRQGSQGVVNDLRRCFADLSDCEAILKKHYSNDDDNNHLPKIYLYHGEKDVNAPISHSEYMHKELFQEKSTLKTYENYGHFSLIMGEADTYVEDVARS